MNQKIGDSLEGAVPDQSEDRLSNWTRPTREECPICMLPLPLKPGESINRTCCGKTICQGCMTSQIKVDVLEGRQSGSGAVMNCPFCREKICEDDIAQEQILKLAKAGNHAALFTTATCYFDGIEGYKQDESEAVKWCQRAVEAGSAKAAMMLAECYQDGDGVEKDDAMRLFYLKKACEIGTEPNAFWELGAYFMDTEEVEEGMLNFRKAAICGMSDDYLFEALRFGFMNGCITKEEYAFTLRENQAAANEFKSEGREFAKMMMARCGED